MTARRRRNAALWIGAIAFCALAFYLALTRSFEFTVAGMLRGLLSGLSPSARARVAAVLSHLPVDEDPAAWIVRKAASVVFFGIVGALARVLLGRRLRTAAARGMLVVAAAVAMSGFVEWYERPEPLGDIVFDLSCGLAGGLLAVILLRLSRRL